MGKQETKIVAVDADHILYLVSSPPAKARKSSLAGKSLKDKPKKVCIKQAKKAFMDIIDEYTKMTEVESIAQDWRIGKTVIVISDETNFRYELFPDYKANRRGKEHTPHFLKLRKWARKKFSPKMNIEADDYVAWLVLNGAIGFSQDKDLLRGIEGLWYDTYFTRLRWCLTSPSEAKRFNLIQCVAGDLGDGIKGIEGVAETTAKVLLDKYGWNWDGVVESYISKGYTKDDAILTARLTSMRQFNGKKLKLFKGKK